MKKLMLFACAFTCSTASLFAAADTLFIAGADGVRDQAGTLCFDPILATGEMQLIGGASCAALFPIRLPVGKTIDGIEVAYRYYAIGGAPSLTASLVQSRLKPNLGAIALGGGSVQPVSGANQELYFTAFSKSVPIASGSTYSVQILDTDIQYLGYVAVTYH